MLGDRENNDTQPASKKRRIGKFLLYYLFIYTMSQNKRITNNYFYFSQMMKKNCLSEGIDDEGDDDSSTELISMV